MTSVLRPREALIAWTDHTKDVTAHGRMEPFGVDLASGSSRASWQQSPGQSMEPPSSKLTL